MSEIRLVTPRLLLRPASPEDAGALFPLIDNWNVARWLGVVPWPYTMADMEHFLGDIAAPRSSSPFPVFAICRDGVPIGCAEWRGCAPSSGGAGDAMTELGYWLGEPHWGRGYATEAVSALISHAFRATDAV